MSDFDRLMGDSLKAIRDDHVREIESQVPAARQQIASKIRGRRFTFVIGGLAAAAAAVAVALFIAQSFPDIDRAEPIPPSGPPAVVARIDVPGVTDIEAGAGALWVGHHKGLVGIDPQKGQIESEWPTGGVEAIATDSESVFTISTGDPTRDVSRLPFGTNEAGSGTTVEGTPTAIAASDEGVWVAAGLAQERRSQITALTSDLEVRDDSPPTLENSVVADMTYAEDALWISASAKGLGLEVRRYVGDTDTGWDLSEEEGSGADIVVGEGAAWVLRQGAQGGGGNTITRIDLESSRVVERAVEFEDTLESIAVGEGYLWATSAPTGMNMPPDTRASLHRIDPETLERVGDPIEVAGPGSKLAVGYGYVWVGDPNNKQIVQVDPSTESSPEPGPSTPEPNETEEPEPDEDTACATFLPFVSTDERLTLGLGSVGQKEVPLAEQSPQALVHFAGPKGSYVDVIAGGEEFPPENEERIDVMGGKGTLHAIEDGYAVTFATGGCQFQLLAYGSNVEEVREFVGSLELRGHGGSSSDAFALWPETLPEDAYESCLLVAEGSEPFRRDPQKTAFEFARDQLGWSDVAVDPMGAVYDMETGYAGFDLIRDQTANSPSATVFVQEVGADCWSVSAVGEPAKPGDSLRVDKEGARLVVGFILGAPGVDEEAASIRMLIEDGNVAMTTDEFRSNGQQIEGVFRSLANGPSAFLILIEDESGRVIGAIGQALPSGDFTAG